MFEDETVKKPTGFRIREKLLFMTEAESCYGIQASGSSWL